MKAFARAIRPYSPGQYIAATDMGTSELDMAVFAHEIGDMRACTGKPSELGGIPHELGTTGYGVATATDLALEILNQAGNLGLDPKDARIAIQGFGNVGSFTAKFLDEMDYKIVAISDVSACVHDRERLDISRLMRGSREVADLRGITKYARGPADQIFEIPADIFVPAAISDAINERSVRRLLKSQVRMVVEAANIPTTKGAESVLEAHSVTTIPDVIVNAGGVIGSYVEHKGGTEKEAFDLIKYKITNNLRMVLGEAVHSDRSPRAIAEELAMARVRRAMLLRKGAIDVAREAFARRNLYEYGVLGGQPRQ
jgi:glutamate dehydrogenase (NAD(P)+)